MLVVFPACFIDLLFHNQLLARKFTDYLLFVIVY